MTLRFKIISMTLLPLGLLAAYIVYPSSVGTRTFDGVTVHTFTRDFTNVHLVSNGDNHLMIDAGLDRHRQDLEAFIKAKGLQPADLSALIITHAHHDHAGTAAYFQEEHGVRIIGGQSDLPYFQSGNNGRLCPTGWLANVRHGYDQQGRFKPFLPDTLVADQLNLSASTGIPAQVFSVPGHTPGSLVITINNIVFVGDMFRGGLLNKSSAAMHFYQCDVPKIHRGLKRMLTQLTPNGQTFFPSHLGSVSRSSVEKMLPNLGNH